MVRLPLDGMRVVDLTRVWAGPLATRVLGDLGAEVIKVEALVARGPRKVVPGGSAVYPQDGPGERHWNRQGITNKLNRSKLGVTLDLSRPEGIALLKGLVRVSDVVINNYSARVMKNFGLHYEALKELNPAIIDVAMPGFGMYGPYRDYLSLGTVIESATGLASLTGYEGGQPLLSGVSFPDPAASVNAVSAILFALWYRRRTGKGQFIDLSQAEVALTAIGDEVVGYGITGHVPPRMGNRHRYMAPHGCYRCQGQDKWVAIAIGSDEEWEAFCAVIGRPAWTREERFASQIDRWRNQDSLDGLVERWTVEHDHHEAMQLLQAAGVAAGAVLNAEEFVNDPHLKERGFFVNINQPDVGTRPYPGLPIRLSKTPVTAWRPAPGLGEHNEYVLGDLMGLSLRELVELEQAQVIGQQPPAGPGMLL